MPQSSKSISLTSPRWKSALPRCRSAWMSPTLPTRGIRSAIGPRPPRKRARTSDGRSSQHSRGRRVAVDHDVAEEGLVVPLDADEVRRRRPRVGLVVQTGHRRPRADGGAPGEADASWMRPSIQRNTEQTRVSPAADASTVVARPGPTAAPARPARCRPDGPEPGDLGPDGRRGVDPAAVPLRPVHPDEVPPGGAVVPERGVLAVGDEREPTVGQRIPAERGLRHLPEPWQLRAPRGHTATVRSTAGGEQEQCQSVCRETSLLTGPPAAGKSTTARVLADAQPVAAMIDVDDIRQLVVAGHAAPWDGEAGLRQQRLGVENACDLAGASRTRGSRW